MNAHPTMQEGLIKSTVGTVISTFGTINVFTTTNEVFKVLCVVATFIAAIYTVFIARATLKQRQIENVQKELILCQSCKAGEPPMQCPMEVQERPTNCPLNKLKEKGTQ